MRDTLAHKIKRFPQQPGIYLMKDRCGEVVYVGKAVDLKKRVSSYFRGGGDESRLITRRIGEVRDVDFVVAQNEKEAFILENNFIKQFRPKYNVLFRDDKSFVSIKIPLDESYPGPIITRRAEDPNAKYYGPYSNAAAARETLEFLHTMFPLRKCTPRQFNAAVRPCLYGQMGRCLAPCCREVPKEVYGELLKEVSMLLEGKSDALLRRLRADMNNAADALNFEKAAVLRDRIKAVEETIERQLVDSASDRVNRDVFGYFSTDKKVWVAVLFIRGGAIRDAATYSFSAALDSAWAIVRAFINQFYINNRFVPDEILLPVDMSGLDLPADWLRTKCGKTVKVLRPLRGRKERLVRMASRNAEEAQRVNTLESEKRRLELDSLRQYASLEKLPRNIECFDISNLNGREAAGSMVVFRSGVPEKKSYRRFKIRDVEGQDDFAMMREVIERRYKHVREKTGGKEMQKMPDLIVVDGGKGQLKAACRGLENLGVLLPDVVAIAKARPGEPSQKREERIFLADAEHAIVLDKNSHAYRLLTRIRDEAHRFAIRYHRKLRRKASMKSPLTEIPGIGEKMAGRLLDHFKSLERIKQADVEELSAISGISHSRAVLMRNYMDNNWT